MYKILSIVLIISHCHASSYAADVGQDRGLGGAGFSSFGPIQFEPSKRNFDAQQNLLNRDQNPKQTFNVPASDFPIKVLFNRQNQNGVMIQEQQIPRFLENIVNANPENDRPVVINRQNLGNILVPYSYFFQQSPQNQQQVSEQQVNEQPPKPIAEQQKPSFDQNQGIFDQNQPILNQRQVNISPLVIGQRDPNVEQNQPNFALTQSNFEKEGVVVDRRQPIIFDQRLPFENQNSANVEQTNTDQRHFTLNANAQNTQTLPVDDQRQKLIYEQLSHFIGQSQPSFQQQVAAPQDSGLQPRQQFFLQLQPENNGQPNEEQPTYREETPAPVPSADVSNADAGSSRTTGLGWSGETMVPELNNADWWRSGRVADARAQMARSSPF